MKWSLANPFGILVDPTTEAWNAGHVNDVLELTYATRTGGGIVVGKDSGGVWLVTKGGDATPLSNDWDNPNIRCLAFGPDGPEHIYAGCYAGTGHTLWVTDIYGHNPLFSWLPFSLPVGGNLNRIVVLKKSRRIVFASDDGLWWSDIPSPDDPAKYLWKQVTPDKGLPSGHCYGLAEGPNETIVVTMPGMGLFYGGWIDLSGTPEISMHKAIPY